MTDNVSESDVTKGSFVIDGRISPLFSTVITAPFVNAEVLPWPTNLHTAFQPFISYGIPLSLSVSRS